MFAQPSAGEIRFNRDIRPILSDKCFACHGPDADARKAELRLDRRADALKVLSPGNTSGSELIKRVSTDVIDDIRPPPETHKPVSSREIALLKEWINGGAEDEGHWAFLPLADSPPPASDSDWPRNSIDPHVLKQMRETGLSPSGRATRQKLIRRISLDLTGLPPRLQDVDAFVQATDFDQALHDLIQRLQASPQFGEHMA